MSATTDQRQDAVDIEALVSSVDPQVAGILGAALDGKDIST